MSQGLRVTAFSVVDPNSESYVLENREDGLCFVGCCSVAGLDGSEMGSLPG